MVPEPPFVPPLVLEPPGVELPEPVLMTRCTVLPARPCTWSSARVPAAPPPAAPAPTGARTAAPAPTGAAAPATRPTASVSGLPREERTLFGVLSYARNRSHTAFSFTEGEHVPSSKTSTQRRRRTACRRRTGELRRVHHARVPLRPPSALTNANRKKFDIRRN